MAVREKLEQLTLQSQESKVGTYSSPSWVVLEVRGKGWGGEEMTSVFFVLRKDKNGETC